MDIVKCLERIRPNEQWSLDGDTYDELMWLDSTPKPTLEEIEAVWPLVVAENTQKKLTQFVQNYLDKEAQKRGYDNIVSATSYAGYANQFQAEGIAFGVWRSAVWAACYAILADVLEGRRQVPTEAELLAELPTLAL